MPQVRVYGETQGMQNQLHMQMDTVRRQIGSLRGGAPSGGGVPAAGAQSEPGSRCFTLLYSVLPCFTLLY
jgi:hypothetical protein